MTMRVCSRAGCPAIYEREQGSRCQAHRRESSRQRDSSRQRYTNTKGHIGFRTQVLEASPVCVICALRMSVIADHYPHGRDELIALGLDPNDPQYGRGLCRSCDSRQTAQRQPGGWNNRD